MAILAAVFFGAPNASAQLPGGNQAGLNAAMLKLFGDISSFSSKADVRMLEKGAKEPLTMTVDFAMLDGKVRMDLDISAIKSKQLPAESLGAFKSAGLDKIVTVVRPDRKQALLIYPLIKSYVEMPMSKEEAADIDRKFKLQKTKLGRESIDGHACEKNSVVVTGDNGTRHDAIVWYAEDLKNFPVQMQMDQQQMTVVMRYRDVKLTKPDAKQFEAPATFTKYVSNEELMQNAMLKMLGGKKP
jgi:hypothetical protein